MKVALGNIDRAPHRSRQTTVGPLLMLAAAGLAALGVLALSQAMLPKDAVLPAIATLLFFMACMAALFSWSHGREPNRDRITYLDVAGALIFIGICFAALVEPDQMVRLIEAANRGE